MVVGIDLKKMHVIKNLQSSKRSNKSEVTAYKMGIDIFANYIFNMELVSRIYQ